MSSNIVGSGCINHCQAVLACNLNHGISKLRPAAVLFLQDNPR